jgi:hypothetical protein
MIEMPDDVITELIEAIVAARADGDGVLTIAAVRACLEAANLNVQRIVVEATAEQDREELTRFRDTLGKRALQRE